mmetsp:Transcript_26958/g.48729  ORF Transcript_26958/g.48729 Transcript_26958/m.48729 type:complete len:131 (+) Transcript_26958:36-428(+)
MATVTLSSCMVSTYIFLKKTVGGGAQHEKTVEPSGRRLVQARRKGTHNKTTAMLSTTHRQAHTIFGNPKIFVQLPAESASSSLASGCLSDIFPGACLPKIFCTAAANACLFSAKTSPAESEDDDMFEVRL